MVAGGAAVWVHSREDSGSGLRVSTQFLYVDSTVLAQFQTSSAFAGAAESYGGINKSAVYLQPKGGNVVGAVAPVTPSGGGSETPSGGGSGSSDPVTPGGGDNTGGGSQDGGGGDDEPGGDDH